MKRKGRPEREPHDRSVAARPRWWARTGALAVAASLVALCACEPAPANLVKNYKTTTVAKLTPDGTDTFDFRSTTAGMVITAPASNTSANLRMVGFKKAWPASANQQACASWARGAAGNSQPGVALRIAASPDRVRAVTITNNIIYGVRWGFNIHLGDSAGSPQMNKIGEFWIDWQSTPLPWTICGRVEGRTLTAKVWPSTIAEPAWGDPAYGIAVQLPAAWVYAGRPGFYVGHLARGQEIEYSAISGGSIPADVASPPDVSSAPLEFAPGP